MRVLVGVARRGGPGLLAELDRLLPLAGQEVLLVHVIDPAPRSEMEHVRARLHRPMPHLRIQAVGEAERRAGEAALREAAEAAARRGAAAETLLAEGEPGRALAGLAAERRCHLVAVAGRVDARDQRAGPRSVGHTARFVLDHAPCPVLLLRGRADA